MGKVEKVVVLSVLFLIAIILVVSVTVDDPLDKSGVVEAGGRKPAPAQVAQTPPAAPAQPLLSTQIQPAPVQPAAQPIVPAPVVQPPAAQPVAPVVAAPAKAGLPPGALLKSLDGLEDSWLPELKLYQWKEGDSWRSIAHHYYGDWQRLDVLKRHNEGRMDVAVGDKVYVPVFADGRSAAANAPAQPAAPAVAAGEKSSAAPKRLHVVQDGDSLWKIAKKELGDGNRWKDIYDLNRDVLPKPESIKKGMRLRLP